MVSQINFQNFRYRFILQLCIVYNPIKKSKNKTDIFILTHENNKFRVILTCMSFSLNGCSYIYIYVYKILNSRVNHGLLSLLCQN